MLYETLEYCRDTTKGYADASWANAQQCSSQQGCLVLLTHCTEVNARCNVIDWRSNRSTRVCRSTLSSEAMSCDDCVAYFVSLALSELLSGEVPSKEMTSYLEPI